MAGLWVPVRIGVSLYRQWVVPMEIAEAGSRGLELWWRWLQAGIVPRLRATVPLPHRPTHPELRVGWHVTPLGCMFVAVTGLGISHLMFRRPGSSDVQQREQLACRCPDVRIEIDEYATAEALRPLLTGDPRHPLVLDVVASVFEARVWNSLITVPPGRTVTYAQLAEQIGQPTAGRAVGRAVGANPVALLIPCHRVVPRAGGIGSYRWGVARKRRLLAVESRFQDPARPS
ncbi:MAG: methylated-DNA--[protein]-cysteine S-methyltransferase [Ectothiorhodospiraceae bacterium]|nr:methylated-DNA--[protein]-cysteine S-methyltransferase [Ectothiorhodospiraceae bacterium]MCH8504192.1 methylated-DNA--[protein]-cysteine S-methyltransferase [Ectothiorhodospiraceae bacterium]